MRTTEPNLDYRFGWRWLIPVKGRAIFRTRGFSDAEHLFLQLSLRAAEGSVEAEHEEIWIVDADRAARPDSAMVERMALSSVFAVVGRRRAAAPWFALLRRKFPGTGEFALLAPGAPRVVVPLSTPAAAEAALVLHRPGRRSAQLAIHAAKLLLRVGISRPLRGKVLCIATRDRDALPSGARQCAVDNVLAGYRGDFALYLGTPDATRKTVALPVSSGAPSVLIKMASTPQAARVLRRELRALHELASTPLANQVPRCIHVHESGRVLAVYQEYRSRLCASRRTMEDGAVAFLSALSAIDRTETDARVAAERLAIPAGSASSSIHRVIRMVHQHAVGRRVWAHRTHGDFAPWNCTWTRGGFFVYDWEASERSGLAFSDAFHFCLVPALRLGSKRSTAELVERSLAMARHVAERGRMGEADIELHFGLWLVQRSIGECGGFYLKILDSLATTWQHRLV